MITSTHIRRHWWIVAGAIALGLAAALAVTLAATPRYTSQASLVFSLNYSGSATDANQGASFTISQIPTFAELASSERILEPVIEQLSLDVGPSALADRLEVSTPPDTSVLEIEATAGSGADAAALANAVAAEVRRYVTRSAPIDEDLGPLYTVTMIGEAMTPSQPSSPNTTINLAAGGLVGLLVGLMLAAWREGADTRVRSVSDLRALTSIPVIGAVRHASGHEPSPDAMARLAVRLRHALRSAVTETDVPQAGTALLLTSATRGGGTSTIARGVANALGGLGSPATVVLAEGPDAVGGSTADGEAQEAAAATVTAPRHGAVIDARADHEIVLVDAPAVPEGATAMELSTTDVPEPLVDATVLVVDARRAHRRDVLAALDDLGSGGARVLGLVLNRAHADETTARQRERVRRSDPVEGDAREQRPRTEGLLRYFVKTNGGEAGV